MACTVDARAFGAAGDGRRDDTAALQRALDAAAGGELFVGEGTYRVTETLYISSHTTIRAHAAARILHSGEKPKHRGDFLITNRNKETGDCDIAISGGIWDGCAGAGYNVKPADLFDETAWSGALMDFHHVKGLRLSGMVLENSVCFHVRLGRIEDFRIEDIRFQARQATSNQDGLHFSGYCRNGVVQNIVGIDPETNDDMIAVNADDCLTRLENRDLVNGPIEDIVFRNIFADNCHTGIRMASVVSPIRNLRFENVRFGCRCYAVNMDAARYCRTPLFREEAYPMGCGRVENVVIDGMTVFAAETENDEPLIVAEEMCRGLEIRGFYRDMERDARPERSTLRVRNVPGMRVSCGGTRVMDGKADTYIVSEPFDTLTLDSDI